MDQTIPCSPVPASKRHLETGAVDRPAVSGAQKRQEFPGGSTGPLTRPGNAVDKALAPRSNVSGAFGSPIRTRPPTLDEDHDYFFKVTPKQDRVNMTEKSFPRFLLQMMDHFDSLPETPPQGMYLAITSSLEEYLMVHFNYDTDPSLSNRVLQISIGLPDDSGRGFKDGAEHFRNEEMSRLKETMEKINFSDFHPRQDADFAASEQRQLFICAPDWDLPLWRQRLSAKKPVSPAETPKLAPISPAPEAPASSAEDMDLSCHEV